MKSREQSWYNGSAKNTDHERGSLHGQDSTGSVSSSTNDELLQTHGVMETAIRYKMSRKTVIKWRNRWDGTQESLKDRSRRPHRSPRQHSQEEIRVIRRVLKKHHWSDVLLSYQVLQERYGNKRSYGGFKRIAAWLKGAKPKRKKPRKPRPYTRAAYPGQKLQLDVKYVPSYCVTDSRKYYQFTAKDECTAGHSGKCTTN